jgi:N-acylneuraminate cytidylyltransferase
MKVLIPARVASKRVPNKNWRTFANGLTLFDIKARQLLKVFAPQDVYVNCDSPERRKEIERYGFNFQLRDPVLCSMPGEKGLLRGITEAVPGQDDIMLISLTDPFYDEFRKAVNEWETRKGSHDSLMVVRPCTDQVLDANGKPANFEYFGQPTQELAPWYTISMCCLIAKRDTVLAFGHYIGRTPALCVTEQPGLDIDTETDFRVAGAVFSVLHRDVTAWSNAWTT